MFPFSTGGEGCHSPSTQTLSDIARPGRNEGSCMSPNHRSFIGIKISNIRQEFPPYLQQETLILLHDTVSIKWGEDGVNDSLCVLLVQPLSCHQTGRHKPGVLSQPGQELTIDCFLKAQSLVPINKLCVFQSFGMLATFGWRSLRTKKQSNFASSSVYLKHSSVSDNCDFSALYYLWSRTGVYPNYHIEYQRTVPHNIRRNTPLFM